MFNRVPKIEMALCDPQALVALNSKLLVPARGDQIECKIIGM